MSEVFQNNLPKKWKDRIYELVWPIRKDELSLFLPMALLMFCVLFNFGALRSLKDSLVITSIGAEVISFLKFWLVFPSAIIFTIIYAKLVNQLKFEYIFYLITVFFLSFFVFFAFVLFPNQDLYHPLPSTIDLLSNKYPYLQWFIKISGKWSYALMYIFAELWSVVIINLLFWQFANSITDIKKAKRFYPVLGLIGNIGLIGAGETLVICSSAELPTVILNLFNQCKTDSELTLKLVITAITIVGLIGMLIFKYINYSLSKDETTNRAFKYSELNRTAKLSLLESFKLIASSRYICYIFCLLVCYGLAINIIEGQWKAKIKELYTSPKEYMAFMGMFNIWLGTSCVVFVILGSNIIRFFSWRFAALITPIVLLITGIMFFSFIVFEDRFKTSEEFFLNPVYIAVILGAAQNIFSKASKYSLFDSTKEMAYIPLPFELKTKGKATVEVIGAKFGKSLGAFIQFLLFSFIPFATFDFIAPYVMVIFIAIITLWIFAVNKLYYEYLKITPND